MTCPLRAGRNTIYARRLPIVLAYTARRVRKKICPQQKYTDHPSGNGGGGDDGPALSWGSSAAIDSDGIDKLKIVQNTTSSEYCKKNLVRKN